MKKNFVEISKVYNFVEEIKHQPIFMSNVKYYKNVSVKNMDYVIDKFEQYFKLEKNYRQNYKDKKNIEGYHLRILISDILLERDNRTKLRTYIEKSIELITGYSKTDRLKYVVSINKTVGGAKYLNIYFIDRVIYDKPQIKKVTKHVWVNANTGKRVSKTYQNAKRIKQTNEETIYFSSKIRFKLIHQNSIETFKSMMNSIKEILKTYEVNVFNTIHTYLFEKKHIKKRIKKNGNYYYVNDLDNAYKGVFKEFEHRAIKIYNLFVNAVNMASMDLSQIDVERWRFDIEQVAIRYKNDINKYEESILNQLEIVANGDVYEIYSVEKY